MQSTRQYTLSKTNQHAQSDAASQHFSHKARVVNALLCQVYRCQVHGVARQVLGKRGCLLVTVNNFHKLYRVTEYTGSTVV
jgi:hypothetical protein